VPVATNSALLGQGKSGAVPVVTFVAIPMMNDIFGTLLINTALARQAATWAV